MLLLYHLYLKNLGHDSLLSGIVSQPTTTKSKKDQKQYVACDYACITKKKKDLKQLLKPINILPVLPVAIPGQATSDPGSYIPSPLREADNCCLQCDASPTQ